VNLSSTSTKVDKTTRKSFFHQCSGHVANNTNFRVALKSMDKNGYRIRTFNVLSVIDIEKVSIWCINHFRRSWERWWFLPQKSPLESASSNNCLPVAIGSNKIGGLKSVCSKRADNVDVSDHQNFECPMSEQLSNAWTLYVQSFSLK